MPCSTGIFINSLVLKWYFWLPFISNFDLNNNFQWIQINLPGSEQQQQPTDTPYPRLILQQEYRNNKRSRRPPHTSPPTDWLTDWLTDRTWRAIVSVKTGNNFCVQQHCKPPTHRLKTHTEEHQDEYLMHIHHRTIHPLNVSHATPELIFTKRQTRPTLALGRWSRHGGWIRGGGGRVIRTNNMLV